jgi:hypothetical protein
MPNEELQRIFMFTEEDLEMNRRGKITKVQKRTLKDETSSAVKDLFYIAIIFPTALILLSTVILLVWLFLNSPELIPEIAIGSVVIGGVFYGVRKLLLKDLWDSSTVQVYELHSSSLASETLPNENSAKNLDDDDQSSLYSNETRLPFHLPELAESELKNYSKVLVYYNPTHKRILSLEEK